MGWRRIEIVVILIVEGKKKRVGLVIIWKVLGKVLKGINH
jgi:hypothetical protein